MPREPRQTFTVENANILFRNFSGRPTKFNAQGGDRSFTIELDPKVAVQMAEDGWNIKFPEPRDDEESRLPRIDIKVKFDRMPPRVVCITSTSRFDINEDTVEVLDGMDIASADIIANASYWENNGKSGIAAYLKKLVVVIEEDELDRKWGLNQVSEHEEAVT